MKETSLLQNTGILSHILTFLDPIRDVFSISTRVCRTWHNFIMKQPNTLFKHVYLFERKPNLIKGVPDAIASKCNLQTKALNNLITTIQKTQVHLESFFVDYSQSNIDFTVFTTTLLERMVRCKMFQYVKVLSLPITSNHNYDDKLLAEVLTQASNSLTEFVVPTKLGKDDTKALVEICGRKLKRITFPPDSSLDEETISSYGNLEALEEIFVEEELPQEIRLALIKVAPNLKRFYCPYGNDEGIDGDDLDILAEHCQYIEELGIGHPEMHEMELLSDIAEKTPNIKCLWVGSGGVLGEELQQMAQKMKNLETLIFEGEEFLEFAELREDYPIPEFIKDSGSPLKYVSFDHEWDNLEQFVQFFKEHCPQLEKVKMQDLSDDFITDQNENLYPLRCIFAELPHLKRIITSVAKEHDVEEALKDPEVEFNAREEIAKSLILKYGLLPKSDSEHTEKDIEISRMFDNRTIRVRCNDYCFEFYVFEATDEELKFYFTRPCHIR